MTLTDLENFVKKLNQFSFEENRPLIDVLIGVCTAVQQQAPAYYDLNNQVTNAVRALQPLIKGARLNGAAAPLLTGLEPLPQTTDPDKEPHRVAAIELVTDVFNTRQQGSQQRISGLIRDLQVLRNDKVNDAKTAGVSAAGASKVSPVTNGGAGPASSSSSSAAASAAAASSVASSSMAGMLKAMGGAAPNKVLKEVIAATVDVELADINKGGDANKKADAKATGAKVVKPAVLRAVLGEQQNTGSAAAAASSSAASTTTAAPAQPAAAGTAPTPTATTLRRN